MVTTATEAFKTERVRATTNGHRPPRTPLRVALGRWLGRNLPTIAAFRVAVMQWAGAGLGVAAAFVLFGLGVALAAGAAWLFWASYAHDGPHR